MYNEGLSNFLSHEYSLEDLMKEELTWKYIKPTTAKKIKDVEDKIKIKLPKDVKDVILKYNNGRPSLDTFDTDKSKGHQFKKLLSFNKEDKENVYTAISALSKENKKIFPIGSDSSGNYIAISNNKVVFYMHETGKTENIANDFKSFLNKLY